MVYPYYTKGLAPLKSISCNVPNRPIPLYFACPNNTKVIAMPMICTCTFKPCLLCSNIFYKKSFMDHMFNSHIFILSNYRRPTTVASLLVINAITLTSWKGKVIFRHLPNGERLCLGRCHQNGGLTSTLLWLSSPTHAIFWTFPWRCQSCS